MKANKVVKDMKQLNVRLLELLGIDDVEGHADSPEV
jgi:hypothetical protein